MSKNVHIFAENLNMEIFLDIDNVKCVTISEAKMKYPQLDWTSRHVTDKTWDSRYYYDRSGRLLRRPEPVEIMALADLKTLLSE